jgi:TrmH family RNA methyltransferase
VSDKTGDAGTRSSQKVPVFRVSDSIMEYMSDTKTSQGILAVVRQKHYTSLSGDLFIILDTLQDPGNMGTIFRTAEAAGVSGIIMNRNCVDIYSPKVVRATMGAMFRMPFIICEDLSAEILKMKAKGIAVYAAHLKGEKNHWEFDYSKPVAFMIGNEGNGLSEEIASLSDAYMRIPMMGKTESLNAAVAATVLMYETVRQRMNR